MVRPFEVSCRLDHDVNAEVFPWQLPGIPLGKHRDDVAVHRHAASIGSERPWVSATSSWTRFAAASHPSDHLTLGDEALSIHASGQTGDGAAVTVKGRPSTGVPRSGMTCRPSHGSAPSAVVGHDPSSSGPVHRPTSRRLLGSTMLKKRSAVCIRHVCPSRSAVPSVEGPMSWKALGTHSRARKTSVRCTRIEPFRLKSRQRTSAGTDDARSPPAYLSLVVARIHEPGRGTNLDGLRDHPDQRPPHSWAPSAGTRFESHDREGCPS